MVQFGHGTDSFGRVVAGSAVWSCVVHGNSSKAIFAAWSALWIVALLQVRLIRGKARCVNMFIAVVQGFSCVCAMQLFILMVNIRTTTTSGIGDIVDLILQSWNCSHGFTIGVLFGIV